MAQTKCQQCGENFKVIPARLSTAKFCKRKCADDWRRLNFKGSANPHFKGGLDCRVCAFCHTEFECRAASSQRFCTKDCADRGGLRYEGEDHPNYRPNARRRLGRGKQGAWARAVFSRDNGTCQQCGSKDNLQAHHIKPFVDFPELRTEVGNGLTLCAPCHWAVHSTASNANGVNSGNILPGNAGDNPEPSFGRKPVEGVTTNGRAYRRWFGKCDWCGSSISKTWSDVAGKAHLFCNKKCMGKHRAAHRTYRPWKNPEPAYGSNSDTSAPPERDDIV